MNAPSTTTAPLTGRHVAMMFVGFFGIVVAVNFTMAFLARKSWTGLIVQNSYVASQHFNAETQKREAMRALRYRLVVAQRGKSILLSLNDAKGFPLQITSGKLALGRGSTVQHDVTLDVSCQSNECSVPADLASGRWEGEAQLLLADGREWSEPVTLMLKGQ
jgi:nitrogen fixation protein FixH